MKAPLVYVWIGENLPLWVNDSLVLSKNICGIKTILLTNKSVTKCDIVDNHIYIEDFYDFDSHRKFDYKNINNFRDGFWIKSLERFLVLRKFMVFSGISKIFHAELDNIIFNISELSDRLDSVGIGFFCPRDAVKRGIASLVYINDFKSLDCFIKVDIHKAGALLNDMVILGSQLKSSKLFFSLPTDHSLESNQECKWKSIDHDVTHGIFDAASLGQYLFGIDPRNTFFPSFNGFVNENSCTKLKHLNFHVDLIGGLCEVSYKSDINRVNVYNLHVHSKIFNTIKNPEKFNVLIKRINKGKRTLVKRYFGYGS